MSKSPEPPTFDREATKEGVGAEPSPDLPESISQKYV